MSKIALYIIGGVVILYLLVSGIKYGCSGISHEGRVIKPGEGTTTIE